MTVVRVSVRELQRVKVLVELGDGRLGLDEAATLLGVGRRQLLRLRSAFQAQGPTGLVSRKRGRPSNRAHGATLRQTAVGLVRDRYAISGRRWRPRSCWSCTACLWASRPCGSG